MPTSSSAVDWPAFIAQHDMHFDGLPQDWHDAPHLGNAMVGSMLYRAGDTIQLHVFRNDVQDHRGREYGWTAYSRPRLLIGYFALEPVGRITGGRWRKDLWNAELTGTITTDQGEIRIRHFVHAIDMAIVTELEPGEGEEGLAWTWHPAPAETTRPGYPRSSDEIDAYARRYGERHRETLKLWEPNPDGRLETRGDVSVWGQDLLAGGQYATAWAEGASGETRTHVATIAHTYPEAEAVDTAVDEIERFKRQGREDRQRAHRQWWHDYYRRSYVSIPDSRLESLYWQTIYRYGCTSRGGRFHVDTAGMWFQGMNWPYTTNDWNTQSAHWAVYAANRLDQGAEIVNRLDRYRSNLIDAVDPPEWREDSAYLSLATAGDLIGGRGDDMRYYDFVGGLPWLLHNAWWQYRFSMDDTMLRETIFPLLRRAVNLYLHLLEEGDDGRWHLTTYTPEVDTYRDSNFDLSLLKWGCATLLKACARLEIDDELIPRWQDVIERLADFPVDESGFMLAAEAPAPAYHRHLSHLMMIYPLHLVHIDQPGVRELLDRSYEHVHHAGRPEGDDSHPLQAMVQTHAAPIACALERAEDALEGLNRLADELSPAGHWPPHEDNPCIESTLGLANIIQDMLIQSWSDPLADEPGPIRIFPAVPDAWEDVTFHDLRAEDALEGLNRLADELSPAGHWPPHEDNP
ncbi:MAG: hypothetical protein R3336_02395, partial [Phycisphaeraceae bacterium]|nr:hypothetical protein [Phycisphaeraceae bacterium]